MDTLLALIYPCGYVPNLKFVRAYLLEGGISLGDGYQMLLGGKTVRKLSNERWEHKPDGGLTKQYAAGLVNR